MKKGILSVLLVAVMGVTLSACGTVKVEDLLQKSKETMGKVTSIETETTMTETVKMGEETMNGDVKMVIQSVQEPVQMKIVASSSDDTGESVVTNYVMEEDGMYAFYYEIGGSWYKYRVETGDLSSYDNAGSLDLYLSNISSFEKEGSETVETVKCTVVKGLISGDSLEKAFYTMGLGTEIDEETIAAIVQGMGDMAIRMWIDKDGYVRRYELDMTEMMQKAMDAMLKAYGVDAGAFQVENALCNVICRKFNEIPSIELPAEAENAVLMS